VRRQTLLFLLFTFSGAFASVGQNNAGPVTCTQLMAWSSGGLSGQRLSQLSRERGIAFSLDAATSQSLLAAGVDPALLENLRSLDSPQAKPADTCPALLAHAGELIQQKKYQEAQSILQKLIATDSTDASLQFALGYVHQQQEDWDEAFEAYQGSQQLMPGLSDVHSRLAYLLYRADDAEGAIAAARTALSIDPRNAEAYRFLGLGLYANARYVAAVHAFRESLALQPDNADVYYDMGITLRDKGDIDAAAAAYRKAIALNPEFWEAHNNLGMLLHDLKSFDGAVAEYVEAKRLAPEESVVRNNLGNTYCDKGEYDAAIAEFRELFHMDSGWQLGHS
jgi:Flp pilus assembly protein TadD